MYTKNEKIVPVYIEDEMKKSYISYAMSVIVGRALPDVRDGLKPVHRRILYAMKELNLEHNKPYKKSARITGEVLGKFHPHGDMAVYDALVRMVQDFSLRYPLVDGQGNFGSVDGDSPAAMRYCVTGDSLVITDKGLIPIEKLGTGPEADINIKVLGYNGVEKQATKFFNSDRHDLISLTTLQGYGIKGSYNHPLLCWAKINGKPKVTWKLIKDIRVGDCVIINRNHAVFNGKKLALKSFHPANPSYTEVNLPETMSEKIAFLLGALVSEGSFHQDQIVFNNSDEVFYEEVKKIFIEEFKGVGIYERKIKGGCKELSVYHQMAVQFLENIGLTKTRSEEKEIPFVIFRSSKECVISFLRALFEGDGSVSFKTDKRHKGHSIELVYNSKSKKLINQLKILLLQFGVATTFPYRDKRNGCYKLIISGYENIEKFQNEIGFFSERKKNRLAHIKDINPNRMSKTDFIPFLSDYWRAKYKNAFLDTYNIDRYNNLKRHLEKLLLILDKKDKQMAEFLLNNRYLFDRVKSLEQLGPDYVYSIRVNSKNHSFVANGFINHNTEARMAHITDWMLGDIEKDTVKFVPNFDDTLKEPTVLPAALPNLLVNGSSGIAVGMATNIPPHNLGEVTDGVVAVIENPDIDIKDLMKYVKGPDFPTGGIICGKEGIIEAYKTGRGRITLHAKANTEELKSGKQLIIITEIPYQVNKTNLIESIADLVQSRKVEGISDIRDESDKDGMRIAIELRRDQNADVILNQLYKHTQMQTTFGIIMLALVDNRPEILNLKETISHYIKFRKEIIINRTKFDLAKAEERAHILEGLKIALKNLDKIINLIKKSKDPKVAKEALMKEFELSERQAQAILEMQLQRLTNLEREKIDNEYMELLKKMEYFKSILESEKKVLEIIKSEALDLKSKFGDERKTAILGKVEELEMEDLIAEEDVVITISHSGYIKRLPVSAYHKQKRGGKGVTGAEMKEEDFVEDIFIASTHENMLFFTDKGKAHLLKVYDIPQASKQSKGKAIVNLLSLSQGEKTASSIPVKEFKEARYLFMVTKNGTVKKTELTEFANIRRGGINAINIEKDDALISTQLTEENDEIFIATKEGKAIRFPEKLVRSMGRNATGVRGIRLAKKDEVVGMAVVKDKKATLLTVTKNGFGKRTPVSEYRLTSRGGSGVINMKVTSKNGPVVGLRMVSDKDDVMLITHTGMIVRCAVKDIRTTGRAAQGVRVIKLKSKDSVVSIASVVKEEDTTDTAVEPEK